MLIRLVRDWNWPTPTVYADVDQPGSQLAALIEAISLAATMPCALSTRR